jgi:hypothetical protein
MGIGSLWTVKSRRQRITELEHGEQNTQEGDAIRHLGTRPVSRTRWEALGLPT